MCVFLPTPLLSREGDEGRKYNNNSDTNKTINDDKAVSARRPAQRKTRAEERRAQPRTPVGRAAPPAGQTLGAQPLAHSPRTLTHTVTHSHTHSHTDVFCAFPARERAAERRREAGREGRTEGGREAAALPIARAAAAQPEPAEPRSAPLRAPCAGVAALGPRPWRRTRRRRRRGGCCRCCCCRRCCGLRRGWKVPGWMAAAAERRLCRRQGWGGGRCW